MKSSEGSIEKPVTRPCPHESHDPLDVRVSASIPALCQVEEDGLGYKPDPDWTPGMGIADIFEDGKFVLSILPFIDNELLVPGGARYSGEET